MKVTMTRDPRSWGSITHHFLPLAEVSFGHFAYLDNNVVTESQPTEEEITQEVVEAVQSAKSTHHEEEEATEDSDGDISVTEPKQLSPIEASENSENATKFHYDI